MLDLRLIALVVVLVFCSGATFLIGQHRWQLALVPTLVVALGLRVLVAYLSRPITPADVEVVFHAAGAQIAHGKDPTLSLPAHDWNFLPMMPYI